MASPIRRVLLVSKFAAFLGGVERHVYDLGKQLQQRGVEVDYFTSELVQNAGHQVFNSNPQGLGQRAGAAASLLWNRAARDLLTTKAREYAPDVVHFHSIYHQLSPSVLGSFAGPKVMTLHDYKLAAPCYSLFRDGELCTECVGRRVALPAVQHRCVKQSVAASMLCAAEDLAFRRRYRESVDRFIVPSQFAYDVALRSGLEAESVSVIPWGVAPAEQVRTRQRDRGTTRTVVYIGRLHPTKGVREIIDAWPRVSPDLGLRLEIAGDGELADDVRGLASRYPSVTFHGLVAPERTREILERADVALVPSTFPETMGLSALEALVVGTPIISSSRGALGDLKGPGVVQLDEVRGSSIAREIEDLYTPVENLAALKSALAERDLSAYGTEGMVEAIVAEYEVAMRRRQEL